MMKSLTTFSVKNKSSIMKKLILFISLIVLSVASFAQGGFPNKQESGSSRTLKVELGGFKAGIGLINTRYQDTSYANLTYISKYAGAQIYAKDKLYMRDSTATKWILIGPGAGSGGSGGGSMIYPGAGIPISTGSAWGTSITDNSSNWNTAYSWGNHAGLYFSLADTSAKKWDWDDITGKPTLLVPADTAGLSSRINLKLNISDTVSMLINYVRAKRLSDTASAIRSAFPKFGTSTDNTATGARSFDANGNQVIITNAGEYSGFFSSGSYSQFGFTSAPSGSFGPAPYMFFGKNSGLNPYATVQLSAVEDQLPFASLNTSTGDGKYASISVYSNATNEGMIDINAYEGRIAVYNLQSSSGTDSIVMINPYTSRLYRKSPSALLTSAGGVPTSRTLTINGTSYDLSANRSWTVSTGDFYASDGTFSSNRRANLDGYRLTYDSGQVRYRDTMTSSTGKLYGMISDYGRAGVEHISYDSLLTAYYSANTLTGIKFGVKDQNNLDTNNYIQVSPVGIYAVSTDFATTDSSKKAATTEWTKRLVSSLSISGADSSIFATLYRVDTAKINLRSLIAARLLYTDTSSMLSTYLQGAGASGRVAFFTGTRTILGDTKLTHTNGLYPTLGLVGSDPLMYFGAVSANNPSFGQQSGGAVINGGATQKSIMFNSHSGVSFARMYNNGTTKSMTFYKTTLILDTLVGGLSDGTVHVAGSMGDSTSTATTNNTHVFRAIAGMYGNGASANNYYSSIIMGNTNAGATQGHGAGWQSDFKKTGANTVQQFYHGALLADSIKNGTLQSRYGFRMWDAIKLSGAVLDRQAFLKLEKMKAATAGQNYFAIIDSADYVQLDGKFSFEDDSARVRDFNVKGTTRFRDLGTASADTTTYKPLGISSSGDVISMTYWPGGGGGAADGNNYLTSVTYEQDIRTMNFSRSGLADLTVQLPLANSSDPGLMSAEDKRRLDSNSYLLNPIHPDSILVQKNDTVMVAKAVTVESQLSDIYINTIRTDTTLKHQLVKLDINEPIISFTAGAGFAADTTVFTDSTLYGSFYTGQDSFYVTRAFAVLKGQSGDTLGIQIIYNDSINVTGTVIGGGTFAVNSRTVGNDLTISSNQGVPPGSWVWLKSPTVIAGKKPEYLSITLIGYRKYIAP